MSYGEIRDREQFQKLDARISEFIARFYAMGEVENRHTIILFPGGLGSRLLRSRWRYDVGTFFSHYTAWLDLMFLDEEAVKASDLQMRGDYDDRNHLIIPDGTIQFGTLQPYRGFTDWCSANKLDWFIFAWDWRRRLEPIADFFLDSFLDWFKQRVMELCRHDPLQKFTLVGHSFGGSLVKLILNRHQNPYVQQMAQAVTVGSPFYGYGGQVRRYFEGVDRLNQLKGTTEVMRAVSSMQGPYALMFLDHDTFAANQAELAADPAYPLQQYPSMDQEHPQTVADPYNPLTNADKVRYPKNYLFSPAALAAAKVSCRAVTASLDPAIARKFFNIRWVQHDDGQDLGKTVVSQTWKWIRPDFDVAVDDMPITDVLGAGDGVIPAWSARLVSAPGDNIRTLKGYIEPETGVPDHMALMDTPAVQQEIGNIMGLTTTTKVAPAPVDVASAVELKAFLGGLEASRALAAASADERVAVSRYLATFSGEERERILARIYLDILKTPAQKTVPAQKDAPETPAAGDAEPTLDATPGDKQPR